MVVAGQALFFWCRSFPNLAQPLVTGRDHQLAVVRDARQRARWMKYARNFAGVTLVKSIKVGLDYAFDDFEIVSAGHKASSLSVSIYENKAVGTGRQHE